MRGMGCNQTVRPLHSRSAKDGPAPWPDEEKGIEEISAKLHLKFPVKHHQLELWVINGAVVIPLLSVRSLFGSNLVFLSSTVNGYDGTGSWLLMKIWQQIMSLFIASHYSLAPTSAVLVSNLLFLFFIFYLFQFCASIKGTLGWVTKNEHQPRNIRWLNDAVVLGLVGICLEIRDASHLFGCLLGLDEQTFKVIAYSENVPEMMTRVSHVVPSVEKLPVLGIGSDVRAIFVGAGAAAVALQKALRFRNVHMLNPILVYCNTYGQPFYAIVPKVTSSLIIDFEPEKPYEVPMTTAGALQSYKIVVKAIARLQYFPRERLKRLCDTMVQEVFELTGYDRGMAYKVHDVDHGKVISHELQVKKLTQRTRQY